MAFLIGGANSAADTGFSVANSCRFNDDDSAYLTRSTESPTDVDKYTFSCWIKRGNLGASNCVIFGIQGDNVNAQEILDFNSDDVVWRQTESGGGNTVYDRVTDKKFRDISAWYHIVIAYDSSQGTAGNRCKMYVNGVQETSFSTSNDPSSNLDSIANSNSRTFNLGQVATGGQFFDGYMAEVVFIDGSALAPTSFGEFDEDSPTIWKPIDVSGLTFGTNGFYLDFEDSSNLGNDAKGGTDLTEVNLDATDQATDSPTNNFCTLNPLSNVPADTNTVSEGNCKWVMSAEGTTSTFAMSTGKWYMEYKVGSPTTNWTGVQEINADIATQYTSANKSATLYLGGATAYINGSNQGSGGYGSAWSSGDVGMLAFDADNARIYFGKDGSWWDTDAFDNASPTTYLTATTGKIYYFRFVKGGNTSCTYEANFGGCSAFTVSSANQDANGYGNFEFAVPSGYFALCTKNLATYG